MTEKERKEKDEKKTRNGLIAIGGTILTVALSLLGASKSNNA
jgi:hypothetical protein